MSNYIYDIDMLRACTEFDAVSAEANFPGEDAFFDTLDEFIEGWPRYLRDYNPAVVVYGPEVRQEFLADADGLRIRLTNLKMSAALTELDNLLEALENESTKALSDGLVKFQAVLEITANGIAAARSERPPGKPVIIAVDDMPEILTTIRGVLEPSYKVIGLTNAASAIEAAKLHSPALFLFDVEMPDMSGMELAKEIRAMDEFAEAPILFLSGKSDREKVIEAKNLGINGYILKPVSKDSLLCRIDAILK